MERACRISVRAAQGLIVGLALVAAQACRKPTPPAAGRPEAMGGSRPAASPADRVSPAQAPARGQVLPPDRAWEAGTVRGVTLKLVTSLHIPGFDKRGTSEKGGAAGVTEMTQVAHVTDERAAIVFSMPDSYVPEGTELRYDAAGQRYLLTDPKRRLYWTLAGDELANLLEGGPQVKRSHYAITVQPASESAPIAGIRTVRSDAKVSFDWEAKSRDGTRRGSIAISLAIWHSKDGPLTDAWGDTLVTLLALPFQDPAGQRVIDTLKRELGFPLRWAMRVVQQGKKADDAAEPPELITTAEAVTVGELPRASLAWPPGGFSPASGPYEFGEGGQTVSAEELGQIPAEPGDPPSPTPEAK